VLDVDEPSDQVFISKVRQAKTVTFLAVEFVYSISYVPWLHVFCHAGSASSCYRSQHGRGSAFGSLVMTTAVQYAGPFAASGDSAKLYGRSYHVYLSAGHGPVEWLIKHWCGYRTRLPGTS